MIHIFMMKQVTPCYAIGIYGTIESESWKRW